jgi:hypothetical protein
MYGAASRLCFMVIQIEMDPHVTILSQKNRNFYKHTESLDTPGILSDTHGHHDKSVNRTADDHRSRWAEVLLYMYCLPQLTNCKQPAAHLNSTTTAFLPASPVISLSSNVIAASKKDLSSCGENSRVWKPRGASPGAKLMPSLKQLRHSGPGWGPPQLLMPVPPIQ